MFKIFPVVVVLTLGFLAHAQSGESDSEAQEAAEACTEEEGPIVMVNGEPSLRCVALLGDEKDRAAHAAWRADRVQQVSTGKHAVTVTHRVSKYQAPRASRVDGLRLVNLRKAHVEALPGLCDDPEPVMEPEAQGDAVAQGDAEAQGKPGAEGATAKKVADAAPKKPAEEWVAEIWLGAELAGQCGSELQIVRMDDQIGSGISVLAITEKGILLDNRGKLAWINGPDTQVGPAIRLVWRSDFRVMGPSPYQKGSTSSAKKPKERSTKKAKKDRVSKKAKPAKRKSRR
jgi:hypothetical protein